MTGFSLLLNQLPGFFLQVNVPLHHQGLEAEEIVCSHYLLCEALNWGGGRRRGERQKGCKMREVREVRKGRVHGKVSKMNSEAC